MKKSLNAFPSSIRILNAVDFKRVFSKPVKLHRPDVSFYVTQNGLDFARLGLAIKKRDIKKAVSRNRLRRFIRESFRNKHSVLNGVDIVVMVRKGGEQMSHEKMTHTLDELWKELEKRQQLFCVPSLGAINT